jgi:hypothetical protein
MKPSKIGLNGGGPGMVFSKNDRKFVKEMNQRYRYSTPSL